MHEVHNLTVELVLLEFTSGNSLLCIFAQIDKVIDKHLVVQDTKVSSKDISDCSLSRMLGKMNEYSATS